MTLDKILLLLITLVKQEVLLVCWRIGVLRSRNFLSLNVKTRCLKLEIKSFFYWNVTGKKHFIISPSFKKVNYHTSKIIYLLTCDVCDTQCLGETSNELHIRMNLHREGKTVCPHITEHFNSYCKKQILQHPNDWGSFW